MPFFKKNRQTPPPMTVTVTKAWQATNKEKAKRAAAGRYFRSHAFVHKEMILAPQTHFEAICDESGEKWTLQRVEKRPPAFEGEQEPPTGATQTLKTDLSFFEALYKVAEFEAAELQACAHGDSEKIEQDLGADHFRAFAHAEEIIFTLDGLPHLTEGGHIIGTAEFPESELAVAQEIREKALQIKEQRESLNQCFSQAVTSVTCFSSTANASNARTAADEVVHLFSISGKVNGLIDTLTFCLQKNIMRDNYVYYDVLDSLSKRSSRLRTELNQCESEEERGLCLDLALSTHFLLVSLYAQVVLFNQRESYTALLSESYNHLTSLVDQKKVQGHNGEELDQALFAVLQPRTPVEIRQTFSEFLQSLEKIRTELSAMIAKKSNPARITATSKPAALLPTPAP